MPNTWETLFNLTSFMKYLLCEALLDEKKEPPVYVLHSLNELLNVTSEWIEKIKLGTYYDTSMKKHLAMGSVKRNERSAVYVNINKKDIDNNSPTNNTPLSSSESTYDLSEIFIKLSKEMLNGRPYGHYCRPCNATISSIKDWDNHISNKFHSSLKEEFGMKQGSCAYCKLIIFASSKDANTLIMYHEKDHNSQIYNNKFTEGEHYKNQTIEEISSRGNDLVEPKSNAVTGQVANINVDFPKPNVKSVVSSQHIEQRQKNSRHYKNNSLFHGGNIKMTSQQFNKNNESLSDDAFSSTITPNKLTIHQTSKKESVSSIIDDYKNKPANAVISGVGGDTSENTSRKELFCNSVEKLIISRRNGKSSKEEPEFNASCLLCEFNANSALDWHEHLSHSKHIQKKTDKDREAVIPDLNIILFDNINSLEKFKSLAEVVTLI